MKKIIMIFAGLLFTAIALAQAPQKMTYQAVVRDSSNALLQSSPVGMKVSILQGSVTGTVKYVETHITQTNQNGLLDIEIGGGSIVSGTYANVSWASGPHFLKTEIDPLGGTNYTITSTSELLSVPYSNYSQVSGSLVGASWAFVGAYKENIFNEDIYLIITYLSPTSVSIHLNIDEPETYYGTIIGNTITIPLMNVAQSQVSGTITKNGNILNVTLNYINPVNTDNLSFIKL